VRFLHVPVLRPPACGNASRRNTVAIPRPDTGIRGSRAGWIIPIPLSPLVPFFKEQLPGGIIMGIKPSYIKNLGTTLLAKQREYFTKNFDENKKQLSVSASIPSKRVRNRIAGYITRRMNAKKRT